MKHFDTADAYMREGLEKGLFTHGALGIGRGEQVYFQRAYGRADGHTRYDLASLTKILGPTMLMLLALESGRLTLGHEVGDFLPAPEDKAQITLRMLLTHTSGLPSGLPLYRLCEGPGQAVDTILRAPLQAAPGTRVCYSCLGYILLGHLLALAYGETLDALAPKYVFTPLQMNRTGYLPTGGDAASGDIAPTEVQPGTGLPLVGAVHDENARFLGGVSGNAGIFSDLGDMLRFARMLSLQGKGLLAPATHRLATGSFTQGLGEQRGLGFQLNGPEGTFMGDLFPRSAYGHTGFTGTSLAVDPRTGLYVVLLSNRVHPTRENTAFFPFRRGIHNLIYAAFDRQGGRVPGC